MSKYDLDTKKIKDQTDLLIKEINNFESIVNKMFTRIIKMPTETKEWEGASAHALAEIAANERDNEFGLVISQMKKYAEEIKNTANEFESVERGTKADDKNISE